MIQNAIRESQLSMSTAHFHFNYMLNYFSTFQQKSGLQLKSDTFTF